MASDILAWYDDDLLEWGDDDDGLLDWGDATDKGAAVRGRQVTPIPHESVPSDPWSLEPEVKQMIAQGRNPVTETIPELIRLRGGNRAADSYYYMARAFSEKKDMDFSKLANMYVGQMRVNAQCLPVFHANGQELEGMVSSATLGADFVKLIIKLPANGYHELRGSDGWPYLSVWFSCDTGKALDDSMPFSLR